MAATVQSPSAAAQSDDDIWDAIKTFTWSDTTKGKFANNEEQTPGEHKFTTTIYQLASDGQVNDWYRGDTSG